MKFQLFYVLICLLSINAFSQSLVYEELSFAEALSKAQDSQQIIFVQLVSDCEQCNVVADHGLSGKDIDNIFNNFICIKVMPGADDYSQIVNRYRLNTPSYPTSLFVDHQGNFLNTIFNKSTSNNEEYITAAALALSKVKNPPFKMFEQTYASGNYDIAFLEKFMTDLSENKLKTDGLLEEYVGRLTIDSLYTVNKIKSILSSWPMVGSKIFKLIKLDKALYDTAFWSFSLNERIMINRKIIAKSSTKAIREKDPSYMAEVSRFIRGTYDNYRDGAKASLNFNLRYYKETKDTTNYIMTANSYYLQYLKHLDMDSVCKLEKQKFVDMGNGRRKTGSGLWKYGNKMNDIAWTIYELSDDPEYLGRALNIAKSILIYDHPPYIDTYAHVLYKLGGKTEAIEWQQKAVDKTSSSAPGSAYKLELELIKMKEGAL